jgi:hypothetical protein
MMRADPVRSQKLELFLAHMNILHQNIRFTMEDRDLWSPGHWAKRFTEIHPHQLILHLRITSPPP